MGKERKIIGEFECPILNEAYMRGIAEKYANQDKLLPEGRRLKKLEFLQTMKSPGLKASIIEDGGIIMKIICPYYLRQKFCRENLTEEGYCFASQIVQGE